MADCYDRVLAAIATVVVAGGAVRLRPSIALSRGLAAGSLISTAFLSV